MGLQDGPKREKITSFLVHPTRYLAYSVKLRIFPRCCCTCKCFFIETLNLFFLRLLTYLSQYYLVAVNSANWLNASSKSYLFLVDCLESGAFQLYWVPLFYLKLCIRQIGAAFQEAVWEGRCRRSYLFFINLERAYAVLLPSNQNNFSLNGSPGPHGSMLLITCICPGPWLSKWTRMILVSAWTKLISFAMGSVLYFPHKQ